MEFVYNPMTGSAGFPVYSPLIKDTRAIISAVASAMNLEIAKVYIESDY